MRQRIPYRDRVETIVGRNTTLNGEIYVTGSLRIEGKIEGKIKSSGDIYVGQEASVVASIQARNVIIAGEIRGDVDVMDRVELAPSGRLLGNILAKKFIVGDGAYFQGEKKIR